MLTLKQSIQQADLIIVGQRKDFSPKEKELEANNQQGPDLIQVSVLQALKGSLGNSTITINSWDGMCRYGVVVDNAPYVMILKNMGNSYDTVNSGCGVKTLPVIKGNVSVENKLIPLDEFKKQYSLTNR